MFCHHRKNIPDSVLVNSQQLVYVLSQYSQEKSLSVCKLDLKAKEQKEFFNC